MKSEAIIYNVSLFDLPGHRLRVQLQIAEPAPSGQMLRLPAWIPGSYLIRDFSRQIESIRARVGSDEVPIEKIDSHTWQCPPCGGPLDVEYVIYAWDLSVRGAHIDESHAFFNGTSVFLEVVGQESSPCLVQLNAPPQRSDWKVYTSLPEASGHPQAAERHGFGMYRAPDYDALIDHPVEIGTPQVFQFKAHGAEHEMVFTGVLPNVDFERICRDVQRICEAQIEFFEPETKRAAFLDSTDRYVFMTMVTGDGYGGLEHRSSTALMATRRDLPVLGQTNGGDGYHSFLGLVSHEYFHTWNVKRIKPAVFAPYDLSRPNHSRLLWVFEGFTSYYDDLMLLRSGAISKNDYFKLLGKTIANVHRGSGRHKQSVAESSFDAWTRFYKQDENSPNALVSYYTKGALVALGLDITLRNATENRHSLDDVLRLMWQRYGRDFYQGRPIGIEEDSMVGLIREATGVDVSEYMQRYVDGREDVPLEQLLATQGVTLRWQAPPGRSSLDVRLRNRHDGVEIATVYEDGAAHQGGLSAGDLVVAINGLRVTDVVSLERLINAYQPDQRVTVHVFRRDELRAFDVVLRSPAASDCILASA